MGHEAALNDLRQRGAMIGSANEAAWVELVVGYGLEGVRFAVARAKVAGDLRQVAAADAAKQLKHKLAAKGEAPVPAPRAVATDAAETDELPPSDAPPAEKAATELVRKTTAPKRADYLGLLARFPGITVTELAARAGTTKQSASAYLRTRLDEVVAIGVKHSPTNPVRYWIRGQEPAGEATPAAPAFADQHAEPSPPLPRMPFGKEDLGPVNPMEGRELRPLLKALLEGFVRDHGFEHTMQQLRSCRDLVGA